jgi:hypothetical protein
MKAIDLRRRVEDGKGIDKFHSPFACGENTWEMLLARKIS